MQFNHNQICTTNKTVEVGNRYQYFESGCLAEVTVLEINEDKEGIGFKLRVDQPQRGFDTIKEFDCWASNGLYAYYGMWKLYDLGTYV
jgi:hypothetical protein